MIDPSEPDTIRTIRRKVDAIDDRFLVIYGVRVAPHGAGTADVRGQHRPGHFEPDRQFEIFGNEQAANTGAMNPMPNAVSGRWADTIQEAVVAMYKSSTEAEEAVSRLGVCGVPLDMVSIIGRRTDPPSGVPGILHSSAGALPPGTAQGACFGGIIGAMLGALAFFVLPVVGSVMIIGPLAGFVAGAISGAGVGALVNGLVAAGIPHDQAVMYHERIEAGDFLVILHGSPRDSARARQILRETPEQLVHTYTVPGDTCGFHVSYGRH